jgi:hypothetical protein
MIFISIIVIIIIVMIIYHYCKHHHHHHLLRIHNHQHCNCCNHLSIYLSIFSFIPSTQLFHPCIHSFIIRTTVRGNVSPPPSPLSSRRTAGWRDR